LRKVDLRIPAMSSGKYTGAAPYLRITADTAPRYARNIPARANGGDSVMEIDIPANARTLTYFWPGVGVLRNVPAPPNNAPFPAWQPTAGVAGVVHTPDGKPAAKLTLYLGASAGPNYETVKVVTDAEGHFTAGGLQPGLLYIALDAVTGGWLRQIPTPGDAPLVLEIPDTKIALSFQHDGASFRQYWWIPAAGTPRRIFGFEGNGCADLDLHPVQGWFWALNPGSGDAVCARVTVTTKNHHQLLAPATTGPSLGLSLPMEPLQGLPGAVTLDGVGTLSGIHVEFPAGHWQACPELGQVLGQIDALPPGSYRVTVETAAGNAVGLIEVSEHGGTLALKYRKANNMARSRNAKCVLFCTATGSTDNSQGMAMASRKCNSGIGGTTDKGRPSAA
jgi:hypothetical protein